VGSGEDFDANAGRAEMGGERQVVVETLFVEKRRSNTGCGRCGPCRSSPSFFEGGQKPVEAEGGTDAGEFLLGGKRPGKIVVSSRRSRLKPIGGQGRGGMFQKMAPVCSSRGRRAMETSKLKRRPSATPAGPSRPARICRRAFNSFFALGIAHQ